MNKLPCGCSTLRIPGSVSIGRVLNNKTGAELTTIVVTEREPKKQVTDNKCIHLFSFCPECGACFLTKEVLGAYTKVLDGVRGASESNEGGQFEQGGVFDR